jgi:hypothetical protein
LRLAGREKIGHPRVGQHLVTGKVEGGQLLGPGGGSAVRHQGRHVPMEEAGGLLERGDAAE